MPTTCKKIVQEDVGPSYNKKESTKIFEEQEVVRERKKRIEGIGKMFSWKWWPKISPRVKWFERVFNVCQSIQETNHIVRFVLSHTNKVWIGDPPSYTCKFICWKRSGHLIVEFCEIMPNSIGFQYVAMVDTFCRVMPNKKGYQCVAMVSLLLLDIKLVDSFALSSIVCMLYYMSHNNIYQLPWLYL